MLILTSVLFGLTSMFLSFYINWPEPALSPEVTAWKDKGFFYKYKNEFDIFFIDEPGSGNAEETLVCIHGFPTSSYDWLKVWENLKTKFGRVVALDLLGHGFSSKPMNYQVLDFKSSSYHLVQHNYTFGEQVDILMSLLMNINVTSMHILAHDYGDTVVQELLHRYNQNVSYKLDSPISIKTVELTNGGIFPDTHQATLGQKVLANEFWGPILSKLVNKWIFGYSLKEVFSPTRQPSWKELDDWWAIERYNEGNLAMPKVLGYLAERIQNQKRWTDALVNAVVPLHMTYGPADPVNPPPYADVFRQRLPRATITVLGQDVGHYVAWEAPKEFIEDYFNFLKLNANF